MPAYPGCPDKESVTVHSVDKQRQNYRPVLHHVRYCIH